MTMYTGGYFFPGHSVVQDRPMVAISK